LTAGATRMAKPGGRGDSRALAMSEHRSGF
jgi:hypothetical protein